MAAKQVLLLVTLVTTALPALLEEAVHSGRGPEPQWSAAGELAGRGVDAADFHESRDGEWDAPGVELPEPAGVWGGAPPAAGEASSGQEAAEAAHSQTPAGEASATAEGGHFLNATSEKPSGGLTVGPASAPGDGGLPELPGDVAPTQSPESTTSGTISGSTVHQDIDDALTTVLTVSDPGEHSDIWNYTRSDNDESSAVESDDSTTTQIPHVHESDTETNRPKCRHNDVILNCSYLGLQTLQTSTRVTYVEQLILSFNHIKNLTRATFAGLGSLRKVFADHNEISFVSEDAFWELPELEALDLSSNHLRQLAPGTLSSSPQLFILDLSGNPLEAGGLSAWLRSHSLGVLYLNGCDLGALNEDAFSGAPRLLYLHLCANGLHELPPRLFRELAGLRHLYLDRNLLSELPADAFADNPQLEWLFARHNRLRLRADAPFLNASSLLMLDLEGNRAAAVGARTFAGLSGLHNLTLRGNALARWAGAPPLPRLRYLDLSWNRLRLDALAPFPAYPRLACANLGGNPAACDPAVSAAAFCLAGCRVSTPPRTGVAPEGNCTRRLLVKFSPNWVPRAESAEASSPAGGSVVGAAGADAEAEEGVAAARVEAAMRAAYAGAASTILLCLAATAAAAAWLAVRARRRRRDEKRLLDAYCRRSLRPRLERLEAMSRAADSLEALAGAEAGAAGAAGAALRTATVGRTATLTRAAAAASLVAAETPLLAAEGDADTGAAARVDISCWLPERRRPATGSTGRKLF